MSEEVDVNEEVPTGVEGCLKIGAVIECPDGKYLKDGSTIDTIQQKVLKIKPSKKRKPEQIKAQKL